MRGLRIRLPVQTKPILPSEWSVHPLIVQRILRIWNFPMVDLFAIRRNRYLPPYVSPAPDDQVWPEDALSIDWTALLTNSCPLTSIISKVLEKDSSRKLPSSTDSLSMANPILILSSAENVSTPSTQTPSVSKVSETDKPFFHSNPGHLKLHAWKLQGGISRN